MHGSPSALGLQTKTSLNFPKVWLRENGFKTGSLFQSVTEVVPGPQSQTRLRTATPKMSYGILPSWYVGLVSFVELNRLALKPEPDSHVSLLKITIITITCTIVNPAFRGMLQAWPRRLGA